VPPLRTLVLTSMFVTLQSSWYRSSLCLYNKIFDYASAVVINLAVMCETQTCGLLPSTQYQCRIVANFRKTVHKFQMIFLTNGGTVVFALFVWYMAWGTAFPVFECKPLIEKVFNVLISSWFLENCLIRVIFILQLPYHFLSYHGISKIFFRKHKMFP